TLQAELPTLDWLTPDAYRLAALAPAYASPTGELNSILQYFYHYFNFDKCGYKEIAQTLESIAIAEMLHLEVLGKAIMALGAQPVYCQNPPTAFNFYSAKYVTYSRNLVHMIEDDIIAEKKAIALYSRMLSRLKNEQLKDVISRILQDEKLHLEKLEEILQGLKR
ncbi:MAG: manganese catalase family protein, partial [Clostridia bacterium]|nr:manganese catalase family protein [Clostridia bacterium]